MCFWWVAPKHNLFGFRIYSRWCALDKLYVFGSKLFSRWCELRVGGIHEKIDFLNSSQNRYFFLYMLYASAAIYKSYAEVGAYNSSWIKSYEHRSKFIFISARPSWLPRIFSFFSLFVL